MDRVIKTNMQKHNPTNYQSTVFECKSYKEYVRKIKNKEVFDVIDDATGIYIGKSLPENFRDIKILKEEDNYSLVYEMNVKGFRTVICYITNASYINPNEARIKAKQNAK